MHEGISDMNPSVSLRVVTNAETAVLDQVFFSRPLQVPRDKMKMTPLKIVFSIVRGVILSRATYVRHISCISYLLFTSWNSAALPRVRPDKGAAVYHIFTASCERDGVTYFYCLLLV